MSDDYYDYYNDDDDDSNNIENKGQYIDRERVGIPGFIDIDNYINNLYKGKKKLFLSEIESFIRDVFRISYELANEHIIDNDDIKNILDCTLKLNKPEHKNATAYVIVYLVSNRGTEKNIKDNLVYYMNNKKPTKDILENEDIDCAAVIRYARLWLNINCLK